MLTVVLVINGLIGLVCLFVAWRLWKLKNQLSRAADTLISLERSVHRVLHGAPGYITRGQSSTHRLRHNLKQLERQLQRIQQMMTLLSIGQRLWQRRFISSQRSRPSQRSTARAAR
jgi:hypothetical protein